MKLKNHRPCNHSTQMGTHGRVTDDKQSWVAVIWLSKILYYSFHHCKTCTYAVNSGSRDMTTSYKFLLVCVGYLSLMKGKLNFQSRPLMIIIITVPIPHEYNSRLSLLHKQKSSRPFLFTVIVSCGREAKELLRVLYFT